MMPPDSSVRILFVGDMHLGRLPTRVPGTVLDLGGMSLRDLGPTVAWERIVQTALNHRVHAVALAGDLVHHDNAMFEAYGPLAAGVRKLVAQGIIVAAVAGNHDTVVLPRLAAEIDGFHLLGPGGTWSTVVIQGDHGQTVTLSGWSFPSRHHSVSPLLNNPPRGEGLTFGLLHTDLDASRSEYAPVRSTELKSVGFQGWFLGHVHKPDPIPNDGAPFYLGSVTGLKPTETGNHGPVLAQISREGKMSTLRIPVAPLRWEHVDLDCTDLVDPTDRIQDHLLRRLRLLFADLETQLDEVRALGVRVTLTGTIADPAAMERSLRNLDSGQLVIPHEGLVIFVQRINNRVTARIDLVGLANRADPPGLLARKILALENPGVPVPEVSDADALASELVETARQTISRTDGNSVFNELSAAEEITSEEIRRMLARTARLTLAGLLDQTGDAKEAGHAVG
jgi:exonuclease SbcD